VVLLHGQGTTVQCQQQAYVLGVSRSLYAGLQQHCEHVASAIVPARLGHDAAGTVQPVRYGSGRLVVRQELQAAEHLVSPPQGEQPAREREHLLGCRRGYPR